jgi:hypothetical protein
MEKYGGVVMYIVTCIPIARQRLGKHISAKRMSATEGCSLLGNGPVNIEVAFSVWSVQRGYKRT